MFIRNRMWSCLPDCSVPYCQNLLRLWACPLQATFDHLVMTCYTNRYWFDQSQLYQAAPIEYLDYNLTMLHSLLQWFLSHHRRPCQCLTYQPSSPLFWRSDMPLWPMEKILLEKFAADFFEVKKLFAFWYKLMSISVSNVADRYTSYVRTRHLFKCFYHFLF